MVSLTPQKNGYLLSWCIGKAAAMKSDAARREKYLKTAWGKRYIKSRFQRYLTG
jgi:hypothetical protein